MKFQVDPDIRRASTLDGAFYRDPGVWNAAKEQIFARSWQFVADADDVKVPGQVHPATLLQGLLDEPILFTRDAKDRVHCISNVCTHRANIVVEAGGNERFLRCRYHGRRFALDGTFQSMPEFEGVEGFPCEADDLANVPFGQWGKFLFACANPNVSLEEYLRPMTERIGWLPLHLFNHEPNRSTEYLVRGHWALYCDNYLEGLHIPFIHASLNETIDYGNYTTELFPGGTLQLAASKGADDVFDLPQSSPDHGKRISAYYYWFFPNTMFNFYPWGLSINVVRPIDRDLSKVSFYCYVWEASKLGRGAGAELDRVEREDEAVVELVQKGVSSRFYTRGRYSPGRETGTHHFHRMLAAALDAEV
ncbi:MAG: aromatic ring-hydroxylating dioxygenase subunit alpha [Armatimonadota bacterium]|nr:aromatic ring-hydroxylating dioxygenase subunit alpha [Armatimonadota bacterium]